MMNIQFGVLMGESKPRCPHVPTRAQCGIQRPYQQIDKSRGFFINFLSRELQAIINCLSREQEATTWVISKTNS